MIKNIEWAKEELVRRERNFAKLVENEQSVDYNSGKQIATRQALVILNQLDEPEVLSQEWIDERKETIFDLDEDFETEFIKVDELQNLLVPKKELPVIPKFVAEWIEENDDIYDSCVRYLVEAHNGDFYYLNAVMVEDGDLTLDEAYKLCEWAKKQKQSELLKLINGYTIEEEQKYCVMNNENELLLSKNKDDEVITYSQYYPQVRKVLSDLSHYQLTEQEIKDYDPRYMSFAKPVEELEG